MRVRPLKPQGDEIEPEDLISGLRLHERASSERPYVICNMVSTLDGKAAIEGRTAGMSNEADHAIFHHLRSQVDAVMAGATTVAVERYGRIIKSDEIRAKREREGLAQDALAVVVSARLSLPAETPLLHEPGQRVVIATAQEEELPGVTSQVDYLRTGDDLPLLMARLRQEHGVRSILCEGGPTLNSHLLAAGLLDELFLTLAAKLTGGTGAPTIVEGRPLVQPRGSELIWLYEGGGDLFARWRIGR